MFICTYIHVSNEFTFQDYCDGGNLDDKIKAAANVCIITTNSVNCQLFTACSSSLFEMFFLFVLLEKESFWRKTGHECKCKIYF